MARGKGATTTDKAAHGLYDAILARYHMPAYCRRCGTMLVAAYHEERLYSVQCRDCETVTLVKAASSVAAARIVGEPMPQREG